ncbi:DNA internalization-related competence protein ComEC/Rec2 [Shewanella sp. OPT22]|nr:DNA internalization-related competence protein ComEC/Rec2 [Shewanella sp. OPT22]
MNRFMFGFCATSLSAIFWPSLLPFAYVAPGVVLLLIALMRKAWVISGAMISILWISSFTHLLLNYQTNSTTNTINVRAEIIALVNQENEWISADIRLINQNLMLKPNQFMRIYWRTTNPAQPGQVYDFKLKPKSITNVLNQGGFNQQKHFLSRHIIGRGNVKQAVLVSEHFSLRNMLREKLKMQLTKLNNSDLMLALLFGDKTQLSSGRWQQLRHSGTGHLISISGLHLSIVGGWTLIISLYLLSQLAPSFGLRNYYISVALSVITALTYAYLAGFSIPTQRALIMLTAVLGLSVFQRYSSSWERLLLALFLVLIIDPLAMLSSGLWLSFLAISVILLSVDYLLKSHENWSDTSMNLKIKQLIFVQFSISVVLGVVGCLLFGGASLHSIWVNLIVVPLFSVLVIPITLVGFFIWCIGLTFSSQWLVGLHLADWCLSIFSMLIMWVDKLPWSWVIPAEHLVPPFILMVMGLFGFWGLRFSRKRWFCLLFIAPMCLQLLDRHYETKDEWRLHMLDVGQGLAMVIERNNRAVIYDTGARYGDFSYAQRSVVPFLQSKGLNQVDTIVISHGDNDHSGGLEVLRQYAPNTEIVFDSDKVKTRSCNPRTEIWQGLRFEFMWPITPIDSNDGSCVLKVTDGDQSVLLTGDIEKYAERELLKLGLDLNSTVMLAPHHGSKTSSSEAFIAAVKPEVVLAAAGYQNHWGFPKSEVVKRYKLFSDKIYVSGNSGQVTLTFNASGLEIKQYRTDIAPYWYNQLFKFAEFR